jgi:hypothetical protein
MKRFDENDVAKRLRGQTPPPPPDLAARIKRDIPEHVEVPPALTAPRGTLPLIGRLPARHRVLALAATVLVAVAAVLVARRVLLPTGGPPLEVALIESAPAPDQAVAPTAAALPAVAAQEVTAAPPAAEPPAKQAAVAPARADAGKGRQEAASDAATQAPPAPPQPQVMAEQAAAAVAPGAPAIVGGVLAPTAGEADEGRATAQAGFVEARSQPRFDTRAGTAGLGEGTTAGGSPAVERVAARKASSAAPGPGPEPALAPAPTGGALLLLVPAGAVVTFEPTAVARYRALAVPGAGAASIVELIAQERLEPTSPLLTVIARPDRGPAPAAGAAIVLRRPDIAASFRAAPRALRVAYLETRLADPPPAGGDEAAALLAEAEALAAEDPADEAAQALHRRWEAAAGGRPPSP